jgi:hypothetical protein
MKLLEITFSDNPTVDREAGVIRGVKVLGRTSRNGREYSDRALAEAAKFYEGIGVNLNHPDRRETASERPVEAGFGWLAGIEVKADGVFGDLHFLKSHPQAAVIVEAAERNPKRFGLSHNAEGRIARKDGRNVVESIEKVRSVDVVQNPATNSGLFESKEHTMKKTVRQILETHEEGKLLALVEDAILAPLADAPVDVADGAAADDQVAAAFKSMIDTVLDDDGLDLKAKLGKIREILKAQEKLAGADDRISEGHRRDERRSGYTAESTHDAASHDALLEQLLERLVGIEVENGCRALLEAHGRACDKTRLTALAALATEDERVKLIESWPVLFTAGHRPKPAVSRPLMESGETVLLPKDAKSLAQALR